MTYRSAFEQFLFGLMGFSSNIVCTTIAPVVPLEIERRRLSSFYWKLLFWSPSSFSSAMNVGSLLPLSLQVSHQTNGQTSLCFLMLMLLAAELLVFSLAKQLSSDVFFIALYLVCRLTEGMATGFILPTLMTIITAYYQDYSSRITV